MQPVSAEAFHTWAAGSGVGRHAVYPADLCFPSGTEHARFWVLPGDQHTWPHFIAAFLGGLDPWNWGCLWPRAGRWPVPHEPPQRNERVRRVLLPDLVPLAGQSLALRFEASELDQLTACLFGFLAFAAQGADDLYFIPEHGQQIIQTDHHEVVHVACREEPRIGQLVSHMSRQGYDLPTEPPDWTFRWPTWLGPDPRS